MSPEATLANRARAESSRESALPSNNVHEIARDREGLRATFELFNRMSDDLAESYRALESQVAALTEELDRVNQERLRETKSREQVSSQLSNLLELLPGGVIVLDKWGVVSQANPAARELLERDLVGCKWVELIAQCFAPQKDDFHEISLKNGRRVSLATRSLEAQTGQIILFTDQTETRRLQQQVSRNERLSALGKMVSALAHQIRTPLSAALLYAGHLSERELSRDKTQDFSRKIVSRLNHLEQQVRDMLIFAKNDVKLGDIATVSALVDDLSHAVDVLVSGADIDFRLELDSDFDPNSIAIRCNRSTIVGALSNLVCNAVQASAPGQRVRLLVAVRGSEVQLSIIDTGVGISPDTLSRIKAGEAFVSTKAQGTGLGLSVVRAVVKAHKGSFQIDSEPGRGSRARMVLPSHELDHRDTATVNLAPTQQNNVPPCAVNETAVTGRH